MNTQLARSSSACVHHGYMRHHHNCQPSTTRINGELLTPRLACRASQRDFGTDATSSLPSTSQPHQRSSRAELQPLSQDDSQLSQAELLKILRAKRQGAVSQPGSVALVGTGPGDPGLLTLRAVQLMQTADVVLYDRLVSEDILRLVHGDARMVYVGKERGFHTRSQQEIHHLLGDFAEAGATVLRLKGGDPFVFGRGGEEMQYLQQRGIKVYCVPGITAASGICAELGIPLTHRGMALSVRYMTGHAAEGGEGQLDTTLTACLDPHTTLVIYMGLHNLPALTRQLLSVGNRPDTPAVAVERGTTPEQRVVYSTLEKMQGGIFFYLAGFVGTS